MRFILSNHIRGIPRVPAQVPVGSQEFASRLMENSKGGMDGAPPLCIHGQKIMNSWAQINQGAHILKALRRDGTLQVLRAACHIPVIAPFVLGEASPQGDRIYRAAGHVARERQAGLHTHRLVELREKNKRIW